MSKLLIMFKDKYQWIFAIFLPFIRELDVYFMTKVANKASSGDISAVAITMGFNVNARHALFISYVLGSIATMGSTIVIFVLDFLINCFIAFKIIWLQKRRPEQRGGNS